jgi:hypothetical protein
VLPIVALAVFAAGVLSTRINPTRDKIAGCHTPQRAAPHFAAGFMKEASSADQFSKPPCPRQETSQVETRYCAIKGGNIRSITFCFSERKQPGADMIGTSSL